MSDVSATPTPKNPIKRALFWSVAVILMLLVLLALAIFYALATPDGTKWVLSNIATRTGASLTYTGGTLYRGIDVSDVSVTAGDITISADEAHLKLGWRAVLLRQVHLLDAHINELVITNPNPPTGEPFEYPTLKTPVSIHANNVLAKSVRYRQATKSDVNLYDIHLNQARWVDTKVSVSGASLDYDHAVKVDKISGDIHLQGDYPIDALADVSVKALDKVFVDTLHIDAKGTLKRTHGTVVSRYDGQALKGEFVAQALSDDVPFFAKVWADKLVLPYAKDQNITLSDGIITAQGTIDTIQLRLNTDLVGKDIPKGRYQGRAVVNVGDDGMDIDYLRADTASGVLTANAKMSWADEFLMSATITGNGVKVREFMPLEYQDYKAYLPTTLTGDLALNYWDLDKDGNTKWVFELDQKDGEHISATLTQSQRSANEAWHIQAEWQNLVRASVPSLDKINSPHGSATLIIKDKQTDISAKAYIHELSSAPKGDYEVRASILGNHITLPDFAYRGEVGELTGQGKIELAHQKNPLSWQFDLNAKSLKPNAYLGEGKTPIHELSGSLTAFGVMREQNSQAHHDITLKNSDLTAKMDAGNVHLRADGTAGVSMRGDKFEHFWAKMAGDVAQDLFKPLSKTAFNAEVSGNVSLIDIQKLALKGDELDGVVQGKVRLNDGVDWDLVAKMAHLDVQKLTQNDRLTANITGKLSTKGKYLDNKLSYVQAVFDGQVKKHTLLTGDVSFDVLGRGDEFTINHLRHDGQAGKLWAKGKVNAQKLSWDLVANMDGFNAGAFVQGVDTRLSGGFASYGVWGASDKVVALDGLDLSGVFNAQPLKASGSLYAKLRVPKDLSGYVGRLKKATVLPKTPNDFFALQQQIQDNSRQAQHIFQSLKADNLSLSIGDNHAMMNGTEQNLSATINIKSLTQLWAEASGKIEGGLIIANDKHALPTIYADLSAKEVRTADIIVQKASVLGKVVNLAQSPSHLHVEVDNLIAMGRVLQQAQIDFQGTQNNHRLSFHAKNANLQAGALITGGFDGERYQGVVSEGEMVSRFGRLAQRQPSEFGYTLSNHALKVAPHCWQTHKSANVGALCLAKTLSYSPRGGDVNVVVQNLDTSVLSPALPSDMVWQSTLNGKVEANWQVGKVPFVNAVLYSDNGQVGVTQDDTGYVEMPYERISLIAQTLPTGFKLRADVAGVAGQGYADVLIDPYKAGKPIKGALVLDEMNLAVVRPFFPNLQALSGTITMAGGIAGTLNKPLFYGDGRLSDGRLAVFGVPLALSDIQASAIINGTHATLDGRFVAGEGKGVISGQMDWQNTPQAKIKLSGEQLTLSSPPLLTASISPELEVVIRPTQRYVDIKGIVLVPSATIRPPEASASIVTESADVSVIDRRQVGNINAILAEVKPWSINADIGLDLGSEVSFRGFGAKLPLAGTLHLRQSGQGSLSGRGVVQVSERTKIDGIGQNLELNYAQIRFNGNLLNPRLSIEGEKEIQGQTVGVRVKGTANNPDITVFNDAGLSEQQAMNALITGRIDETADTQTSEQTFRSQVTNSLAAAGLSLGLSGTRGITNQIGNALGLESLTVDASGNSSDTNVNITGYLSPDLYIRYGVGVFNAESTLSMRYQLTRRVYVEATRAIENTVDVIYRWKF